MTTVFLEECPACGYLAEAQDNECPSCEYPMDGNWRTVEYDIETDVRIRYLDEGWK